VAARTARASPGASGATSRHWVEAHTAIAREYLARGRRLAVALDEPWPSSLEEASRELWRRELGIDLDR